MTRTVLLSLLLVGALTLIGCAPGSTSTTPVATDPITTDPVTTDTAPEANWQTFTADSGYEISYPEDLYSIRTGPTSPDVLFPGIEVLEPNDAFSAQDPQATTYRISIAVRENSQNLTLDDVESLLAQNAIVTYDPTMLEGHAVQQVMLDEVAALRVDDLPIGQAGVTTQIATIKDNRIYEILVEPFQTGQESASNRDLMERILATFRFNEQ